MASYCETKRASWQSGTHFPELPLRSGLVAIASHKEGVMTLEPMKRTNLRFYGSQPVQVQGKRATNLADAITQLHD